MCGELSDELGGGEGYPDIFQSAMHRPWAAGSIGRRLNPDVDSTVSGISRWRVISDMRAANVVVRI